MKKGFLLLVIGILCSNFMGCAGDGAKDQSEAVEMPLSQTAVVQTAPSETETSSEESSEVSQETEEFVPIPIDEEHFPDEIFRERVRGTYDFVENDNVISLQELEMFDQIKLDAEKNPEDAECKSLEGIQYLITLGTLRINGLENLHEMDLSANTKLTELDVNNCGVEKLDLSACSELSFLQLLGNEKLETLKLDNPMLADLRITYCAMNELDFSKCPALSYVYLCNMNFTDLDFRGDQELEDLHVMRCMSLERIDLSGNSKLKLLDLFYCPIKTLDLSNNVALEYVSVDGTDLTELDLRDHQQLVCVTCENTPITKIDIRGCDLLTDLVKNNAGVENNSDMTWRSTENEDMQVIVPIVCQVISE